MVRTIGWFLLALFGMAVIAVVSLSGSDRDQLMGALGRRSLQHSNAGLGYDDGRLVWRDTEPVRITVEQLPSLEGRRLGTSWNSGFFTMRMSWFGVSLREAIARCLQLPMKRVLGDGSLDDYWFDVDSARPKSLVETGFGDWGPVRARILEGLCEHYGLAVTTTEEPVPLTVLRAGPGWAEHLVDGAVGHMLQSDGTLSAQGVRVSNLVFVLRNRLGVEVAEDLETAALCSFDISWDTSDPEGLRRALADELDLHLEQEIRELPVARVNGIAEPPPHLR